MNGVESVEGPRCVHVICDGNRTYSIVKGHLGDIETFAYDEAWKKLEGITRFIFNHTNVRYLFFTVTARRNHLDCKRAKSVEPTATFLPDHAKRALPYYRDKRVRVKFIGDVDLFSTTSRDAGTTQRTIRHIERSTASFGSRFVFLQVAYDTVYEYLRFLGHHTQHRRQTKAAETSFDHTLRSLSNDCYGTEVPEVDVCIRTMRCRLSNTLPIIVGEYADFYFFPGPFPMIQPYHLERIFDDYNLRRESKGGTFVYDREDIDALQKYTVKDFNLTPVFLGTKSAKVWLPIESARHLKHGR